ncbi:Serine/threonine-protein kinase EDR1 [Pelomyxa schiedti]|nr:Serine/threonine-protein kinase EDR1 [Pelomyxa schiedti]
MGWTMFTSVVTALIVAYSLLSLLGVALFVLRRRPHHRNVVLAAIMLIGAVRAAFFGLSLVFETYVNLNTSLNVLDVTPSLFTITVLSIYITRIIEYHDTNKGSYAPRLIAQFRSQVKILILINGAVYLMFFAFFWVDCMLNEQDISDLQTEISTCIFHGILFIMTAICLGCVLIYKARLPNCGFQNFHQALLIYVSVVFIATLCLFRSTLLFLPSEYVKSFNDTSPSRFSLIDSYYTYPSDNHRSLLVLLTFYLLGDFLVLVFLSLSYACIPSTTHKVEEGLAPVIDEAKVGSQVMQEAEKAVELLLRGKIYSSLRSIPHEELQLFEPIGSGSIGSVTRAKWRGLDVAVKQIRLTTTDQAVLKTFCQEISIMSKLKHPYICQFFGASVLNTRDNKIALVMEYLPLGSLRTVIQTIGLSFSQRMKLGKQIAVAMNYLHTNNPMILHRDFNTNNILVSEDMHPKVADFGLSSLKRHNTLPATDSPSYLEDTSSLVGTPEYWAPELTELRPRGSPPPPYTSKCDVYSYSIVLWELATKTVPYQGFSHGGLLNHVQTGGRLPLTGLPDPVSMLINQCWDANPDKRPEFDIIWQKLEQFLLQCS